MPSVLEDKAEITELKYEYCYATDNLDMDRMREIYTDDGYLDVPIYETVEGHEKINEYFEWFDEQEYGTGAHSVFNPIIDVDGDTATGKWYYAVVYTLPDGTLEFGQGEYDDEYVRTGDGWKLSSVIAKRRITRRIPAERVN